MFSQVFALALVAVASAQYGPAHHYAPAHHDHDHIHEHVHVYEAKPLPYNFGFDVKDEYGGSQTREEEDDGYGNKKGSYGYTDGYGIFRRVDYVADKGGFRATVKTNEPGTDNQDPADVHFHSESIPVTYEAHHKPAAYHHLAPTYTKPLYEPAPSYHVPKAAAKHYKGPYDRAY